LISNNNSYFFIIISKLTSRASVNLNPRASAYFETSIASLSSALSFLFFPRLRERRLVLNKKSIILSNNAFIRVGNEGLDILSSRRAMDKSIASLRSAFSFFIYPSLA
jgi:hypothetical protein